ncbi:hypothetical protein HY045_02470 [Candidatus Woesebacteria bacterium]|nr:hypothetical protein [Candidatus Woesebacteria bacterium]
MRVSSQKINHTLRGQIGKAFYQLVADINDTTEAETFFKDFLNENECETFIKRLAIVYWLKKGRSYSNIKDNLKVSSATIASVQKTIDKEGIQLAVKKMAAEEWANQWSKKIKKFVNK